MVKKIEEIEDILKKYGQEHLLNHYDKLDEKHKKQLIEQIENIDFALIKSLYIKYKMTDFQYCSCSCYRIYHRYIERKVLWSKLFSKSKMKVKQENPAKRSCKYRRNVK